MKPKTLVQSVASLAIITVITGAACNFAVAEDTDKPQQNDQPVATPDQDHKNSDGRMQLSASDSKFAKKAACDGATEVALGKLAVEKGSSEAVKQFGQRMVDDHGKANQQLREIASRKGWNLSSEPTPDAQKAMDKLRGLSGQEFDNEYINLMTQDHKKDLKVLKHESEHADDADLKSFAASTEPVVKEHLKMLEAMPTSSKRTPVDQ